MTLCQLEQKLKKLNRRIGITRGFNDDRPACIYIMVPTYHGSEYEEICGIEKWQIREFPRYSKQGKMLTGGWHRALTILAGKGYINKHESYKYFGHWDVHHEPFIVFDLNKIDSAIAQLSPVGYKTIVSPLDDSTRIEVPIYKTDDTVDIGRMIAQDNKRTSPPPSTETGLILGS